MTIAVSQAAGLVLSVHPAMISVIQEVVKTGKVVEKAVSIVVAKAVEIIAVKVVEKAET